MPDTTFSGWVYALLGCDCVRAISDGERKSGQAMCLGRHMMSKKDRMQPIVAIIPKPWRPYHCDEPAPPLEEFIPAPAPADPDPIRAILVPDHGQCRLAI